MHKALAKYELTKRKDQRGGIHIDLLQDEISKDFVRGLFDADGSFYYDGLHKNNLFAEITGNMPVLKSIKSILVRHKIIDEGKKDYSKDNYYDLSEDEDDFEFITSYETDSFCKPNPQYFVSICERLGVKPEECLMVGNDEREDMYAASSIGMNCFLVTDCIIPCEEHPWNGEKGTFEDLIRKLENL